MEGVGGGRPIDGGIPAPIRYTVSDSLYADFGRGIHRNALSGDKMNIMVSNSGGGGFENMTSARIICLNFPLDSSISSDGISPLGSVNLIPAA